MATRAYPLSKERNLILGLLLILAAAAWAILVWQAGSMEEDSMGLTMGMSVPLFVALWAAMMVAIMFPTAAPMILTFARVQRTRQERSEPFVPTWLFTGSYIGLWSATGLLAYAAARFGDSLADNSTWLMTNAGRIGGGALVLAGLYQISPLKRMCLSKCRSPMSFILMSWRDGRLGAIRMGLEHAIYCLGCCWLLFVILFPLGMMNIAVLAIITAIIFAEKSLAIGRTIGNTAAVALVIYGLIVITTPEALPTML